MTGPVLTLRALRGYLAEHRRATLGDLALHFGADVETVRPMLATWQRKGVVLQLAEQATCNRSCAASCSDAAMDIFEWTQPSAPTPTARASMRQITVLDMSADTTSACRHRS
jgi:hypothetical protein